MAYNPTRRSCPGETIEEVMQRDGVSVERISSALAITPAQVRKLLNGGIALTDVMADALPALVGGTPEFWRSRLLPLAGRLY